MTNNIMMKKLRVAFDLKTTEISWERFLEKNVHQLSDWTKLSVERMLACSTCAR
ncbi:hypothetical protein ACZ87_00684 [Candidatus Erwinia dacicola]|uniref:Uncharacterized protein n=1 Tax=Candidatus Erwinia dacicola TaxID=252393 RepID=A0A328TUK4_9GAMM|nr:hypothetical protein ACZ87_01888 [Candidatus Erwinia dacicola]RAP72475.1 hypothetical protein ACZ87_00684 [Candidatus Erwinia dacicola]